MGTSCNRTRVIWNKIGVLQQVMVFLQAINTPFPADVLNNTWFCDFRTVSPESRTDRMGRAWKKKIIQKRPFNCSWWPNTKILWGLKFLAEKNHVLKTEEKSEITRIVSVRIFVLQESVACSVALRQWIDQIYWNDNTKKLLYSLLIQNISLTLH